MKDEVETMEDERLMTADEFAARLQVPKSWVYAAAREEKVPCVRAGKYVRFRRADVDQFIAEGGKA